MIPKNCGGEYPEWKDVHLEDENSRFVGKFPNVCQTCNYIGACMFKIIHQERTGETIELSEESRQHIAKTYLESMGERQSTILLYNKIISLSQFSPLSLGCSKHILKISIGKNRDFFDIKMRKKEGGKRIYFNSFFHCIKYIYEYTSKQA